MLRVSLVVNTMLDVYNDNYITKKTQKEQDKEGKRWKQKHWVGD